MALHAWPPARSTIECRHSPSGEFTLLDIQHLVRAGMTEMEALIAATQTSADLCGAVDRPGTVEVGKLADLIVVSASPLENISNIRKLKLILKRGQLADTSAPEGIGDLWELFVDLERPTVSL
jgi:imidazolonepropionase-like amidohydrolase